ncbi:MAG TPA: methyl-accepting chemotaxis protein [Burkholderiaceae bacterium]|nr:methyl-accepting chemotaxis protein [Burkholderiaceae bacterium]
MDNSTPLTPALTGPSAKQATQQTTTVTDVRVQDEAFGRGFFGPGIRLFSRAGFLAKAVVMAVVLAIPTLGLLFWQIATRYDDAWDARMNATVGHVEIATAVLEHFYDLERSGTLSREEAQAQAARAIGRLTYEDSGYFWIHDRGLKMVMHPKSPDLNGRDLSSTRDTDGKAFFQEMVEVSDRQGGGFVEYKWQNPGEPAATPKISYVHMFKPWGWVVGSGIYVADIVQAARTQVFINAGVVLVLFLVASYLFISFYRLMSHGLSGLQFHLRAIRDGDLTTTIRPFGKDEFAQSLEDLARMQHSLRGIVAAVRNSTDEIVHSIKEIGAAAHDLASRTEQTASNLTQSASAIEQINATAGHTATNTTEGSQLAQQNAAAAQHSVEVMGEMVNTMEAIRQTSSRISDIVSTIDGIAFQTNILALNAAVEAARSGEAGRGFAVVAGEVRALAQRSAQASREISELIQASVSQVEAGTQIVHKTEEAIENVLSSSERVNVILREIATGAQEQSVGINEVGQALSVLDTMTQQNAAMVEETAVTAEAMNDQAQRLSAEVARFQLPAAMLTLR